MVPVTAHVVLEEMSRDKIRGELVSMAEKIEALVNKRENERALAEHQATSVGIRPTVATVYYVEVWRLDRIIREHRETLEVIQDAVKEVDSVDYGYLLKLVNWLKVDTYHWLGLNVGRVPKDIRQHLDVVSSILRVELSSN